MIDLGQWASGSYVIPGDPPDPEQPSDAPAASPRDRN
jgi:endogenous inhibitor of DNA gyrase (YacG/DUF329 family)